MGLGHIAFNVLYTNNFHKQTENSLQPLPMYKKIPTHPLMITTHKYHVTSCILDTLGKCATLCLLISLLLKLFFIFYLWTAKTQDKQLFYQLYHDFISRS